MSPNRTRAWILAAFVALPITLTAQSSLAPHSFSYDVRDEVTISGAVTSVFARPAPGMVFGSHLVVATASGNVDVSLGRFGLRGKGAPSIGNGEQIEITGVMKTIKGQQLFLARMLKMHGETYTLRSEHGIEISPQARPGANGKTEAKTEARANSL
jgi:hypothetical protein